MSKSAALVALAFMAWPLAGAALAQGTDAVEVEQSTTIAVDGKPIIGTFEATSPDGVVMRQTLHPDRTITTTFPDGTRLGGSYTGGGNGEPFCITNEGETEPTCYLDRLESGIWTSVNQDDPTDRWTVRRID